MQMLLAGHKRFDVFPQLYDVLSLVSLDFQHCLVETVVWIAPVATVDIINRQT